MFREPESCECEGGQYCGSLSVEEETSLQWLLGERSRPVFTRLVTLTPEAKPDLRQPPVVGGATPDLPPSYTEVVTSKDGLHARVRHRMQEHLRREANI